MRPPAGTVKSDNPHREQRKGKKLFKEFLTETRRGGEYGGEAEPSHAGPGKQGAMPTRKYSGDLKPKATYRRGAYGGDMAKQRTYQSHGSFGDMPRRRGVVRHGYHGTN